MLATKKTARIIPAKSYPFTSKKVSGTPFPEKLERANKLLANAVLKRKNGVSR